MTAALPLCEGDRMRAVSMVGWVAIALLDLWAGADVLTGSNADDASPVVAKLGSDSVVGMRATSEPNLIALVVGLLVLAAVVALCLVRRGRARRRLNRVLGALGIASVVALALGGHLYALLVPVCLLIGGLVTLVRAADQPRPGVGRRPRPSRLSPARRPSPRPHA